MNRQTCESPMKTKQKKQVLKSKGGVAQKAARSKKTVAKKVKTSNRVLKPAKVTEQKNFTSDIYPVWRTRDGREIRVDEMSTNHLLNTLAHINKRLRLLREGIDRLETYWNAMDTVLAYRNVWVRPGEEPLAPLTEYDESTPSEWTKPHPLYDPAGYLRWARNNPFP